MSLVIEDRLSDSPFVERIWHSRSANIDAFISIAVTHLDLVFWRQEGKNYAALQGPETRATRAPVPDNAEFFGILFKTGTFLPHLPVSLLVDSSVALPTTTSHSFWLDGSEWQFPTYDNDEPFVERLVRQGLLVHDSIVTDVLQGHQPALSVRTVQRRFSNATGLTPSTIQQIERARRATNLLQQGVSILDTVAAASYSDQPHLTKALKHFIGQTPGQIFDQHRIEQMSYLYDSESLHNAEAIGYELMQA